MATKFSKPKEKKGSPDRAKVDRLLERIGPSLKGTPGENWHQAQQILYVADACRGILSVVDKMNNFNPDDLPDDSEAEVDCDALIRELYQELSFLRVLMNEKKFIGALPR